jgi:hypothetical protein
LRRRKPAGRDAGRGHIPWVFASQKPKAQKTAWMPFFEQRKGLKRYPFDAAGGKRYKRKARFPARSAGNAPEIGE